MMRNKLKDTSAFTLIEIMIAVALFSIIMTIGIGAVLNVTKVHKKSQTTRNVLDNIDFIMEDITRNIRLGTLYHCNIYAASAINVPNDCPITSSAPEPYFSFAFEPVGGNTTDVSDQVVYRMQSVGSYYQLIKGKGTDQSKDQILTPAEVHIFKSSGFNVVNASNTIGLQPMVTIRLVGEIVFQDIKTPFAIQTTVTERQINCDATCDLVPITN